MTDVRIFLKLAKSLSLFDEGSFNWPSTEVLSTTPWLPRQPARWRFGRETQDGPRSAPNVTFHTQHFQSFLSLLYQRAPLFLVFPLIPEHQKLHFRALFRPNSLIYPDISVMPTERRARVHSACRHHFEGSYDE